MPVRSAPRPVFHLVPNAHLDPVWLWDAREGLNQGIATCKSVLDLMDEFGDLTFIRGESAVYEHVKARDGETWKRLVKRIKEGRWDVVGGTYIQPDHNLPSTETLFRLYTRGQAWFQANLGKTAKSAWSADPFGHSMGIPEILAECGMENLAFSRPQENLFSIPNPAFYWEGASGRRILCYRVPVGWYGCERDEIPRRLDGALKYSTERKQGIMGLFVGLGDHGGGPSRRQLLDVQAWAKAHPEVEVRFSHLTGLFSALRAAEKKGEKYPVIKGEINYCLRGCYASVARFKFPYRKAEAEVLRTESAAAALHAAGIAAKADLDAFWRSLTFNAFHDIIPGSSIERAYEDQIASNGVAIHQAQGVANDSLLDLARKIDVRVPEPGVDQPSAVPFVFFNPHPWPYRGMLEMEASMDDRPLWAHRGKPEECRVELRGPDGSLRPWQRIESESEVCLDIPWRRRIVFPAEIPAMGWAVYSMGWVESARQVTAKGADASAPSLDSVRCGDWAVEAKEGGESVGILRGGKPLLDGKGLSCIVVDDPWGSWGGMGEEKESFDFATILETWKIDGVQVLEKGPLRAALWVRFSGMRSRLELTFRLESGRDAVDVDARVFWNERGARLKLVLPGMDKARFDVPGGEIDRGAVGEVPARRQVVGERFGFASDSLASYEIKDGALRPTIVRASRYATEKRHPAAEQPWKPAVDAGELRFRAVLAPGSADWTRLAQELEKPPLVALCPYKKWEGKGKASGLPPSASLLFLENPSIEFSALKPAEDGKGYALRLQNRGRSAQTVKAVWQGKPLKLGAVKPLELATWRLSKTKTGWNAKREKGIT